MTGSLNHVLYSVMLSLLRFYSFPHLRCIVLSVSSGSCFSLLGCRSNDDEVVYNHGDMTRTVQLIRNGYRPGARPYRAANVAGERYTDETQFT